MEVFAKFQKNYTMNKNLQMKKQIYLKLKMKKRDFSILYKKCLFFHWFLNLYIVEFNIIKKIKKNI